MVSEKLISDSDFSSKTALAASDIAKNFFDFHALLHERHSMMCHILQTEDV
jgi:hypothetical protein